MGVKIIPNINLFIVGAAKSGTTSLYNYLIQHPDIFLPRIKEPNFYSDAESDNPKDYTIPKKGETCHKRMINDKDVYYSLFEGAEDYKILADASPSYLWDKNAAKRIYADYPNAKIVILLRNPVQRAYSHYLMDLKYGHQFEKNFKQAILNDEKTTPKLWGKAHMYLEIGLYLNQIKKYLDVFGEKKVKVIIYEDFVKDIGHCLKEICVFLNIDSSLVENIDYGEVHNSFTVPSGKLSEIAIKYKRKAKSLKNVLPKFLKDYLNKNVLYKEAEKPKLKLEDKLFLYDYFKEDIEGIEQLLKIDLSHWKIV